MTARGDVPALFFVCSAMFLVGMQMAETGAALERISQQLALSQAQQGVLVSLRFVGGIALGLVLWVRSSQVPIKVLLVTSIAAVGASGLLLLVPSYRSALLVAFIRGVSVGAIIPLSGMFASAQTRWSPGFVAAVANAAVSGGLIVVSAIAVRLSDIAGIPWATYWAAPSVLSVALLLAAPQIRMPDPTVRRGVPSLVESVLRVTDWRLAASGFFLVGGEAILWGLVPAQSANLAGGTASGEVFALFLMAGVFAGRVGGAWWFRRTGPQVIAYTSIAALCAASAAWGAVGTARSIIVLCLGMATANIFPALIALTSAAPPQYNAPSTIAAVGWTGGLGGTVLPASLGFALQHGLSDRLTALALGVCAVVVMGLMPKRRAEAVPSTEL